MILIVVILLFTINDYICYAFEKISSSGWDITPWNNEKILKVSHTIYNINDIRSQIIQNGITEKSYSGRFFDGERYNHKEEGVYVSGTLI